MTFKRTIIPAFLLIASSVVTGISCGKLSLPHPPLEPKALELIRPIGGEHFKIGDAAEISWRINDTARIISVGVKLSLDSGKYFGTALFGRTFPPESTTAFWTVAVDSISDRCVIKVFDYNEPLVSDKSGLFSVGN
jgi:hypothetical protein